MPASNLKPWRDRLIGEDMATGLAGPDIFRPDKAAFRAAILKTMAAFSSISITPA